MILSKPKVKIKIGFISLESKPFPWALVFTEAFYLATKGGGSFFGNVGSFECGYEFDAIIMDDSILVHPQKLNLAERMERAVYLGLDDKKIIAKYVAGKKII